MARVLIAGCGDLGCQLGIQLKQQGHEVFGIRRNIDALPDEITGIECNLFSPICELPNALDYVFYIVSAAKYKDNDYYQAYVLGVRNMLKALQNQKIKRFFFTSSTSVFAQSDGEWVNETSATEGHGFSTNRLLEGEELCNNSSIPTTIIRFGGIYGPGRTHLIDLVREGKAHCMENVWSNRIHSADCTGIFTHLMTLDMQDSNKLDNLYIGVDNKPTPSCEVYEWLAEELSVPEVEHKEPSENSRQLRSNKRLSNERIRQSGYEFKYPTYQDGYGELILEI
ncbi:NAD(P)-dependent oxidoreductase [Thiosulfatimonas sediminis]|uniref:NAD(P)-dependent oxidoreductase n=1 Tax=Thiosulfatimonas sediminis TaxID=2675054 RepID=A0A6F8PX13_9GAMM|nr:NAD-dependent epimerase/dehydratase family protein [Thiosulfatimonas sediminis]BBP46665.1 NAD(P)-dependent oxidoreductase [Thiosulfatimonas sediminis]